MAIQHNVYEGGKVQSLGFTNEQGRDFTIGVLEPGEYDFGVAERREKIHVSYGLIEAKGKRVALSDISASNPDCYIIFRPGEEIKLKCYGMTAYICIYGAD